MGMLIRPAKYVRAWLGFWRARSSEAQTTMAVCALFCSIIIGVTSGYLFFQLQLYHLHAAFAHVFPSVMCVMSTCGMFVGLAFCILSMGWIFVWSMPTAINMCRIPEHHRRAVE